MALEVRGEAELIGVEAHRAREVDRTLADLIHHDAEDGDVGALDVGAAELLRVERDPEGPDANEIAVYGLQPSDTRPPGEYYAAPADSEIGKLVKAIAKID